jgi:hypothetical protein
MRTAPVPADLGEHRGAVVQLGLEQRDHQLGHRFVERVTDAADRGRGVMSSTRPV